MPLCLIFVPPNTEKMKAFFEAIAYLFQEILFGFAASSYWIGQLKKFSDSGEEDTDSTSHSFL
ncbi:MAG: DUF6341 family protein [Flavobacteriaceae bacterium]